jgi:Putative adipose-regulatory protein (Seipin)
VNKLLDCKISTIVFFQERWQFGFANTYLGMQQRLLLEAPVVAAAALTRRPAYLLHHDDGHEPQYHYYYHHVYDDGAPHYQQHNRGFFYWCWRFFVTAFQLLVLGFLSMGSYAVFYHVNQPIILHYQQFQLDYYYGTNKNDDQQPVTSSTPSAIVRLQQSQPYQWTAMVDDVEAASGGGVPFLGDRRIVPPRQAFYVELTLTLPESPRNVFNTGVFGVVTELYGSNNTTTVLLATSRRSLRFPYRSAWIRTVANIVTLPFLLLHVTAEVQTVTDCVFRHVLESETYPLHTIQLRLLDARVEVVAAELRIGEELTPFQERFIKTWFWTCCGVGTAMFATLYAGVYQLLLWWLARLDDDNRSNNEPPCELNFEELSVNNASFGIDRAEQPNNDDSQQRGDEAPHHNNSEPAHFAWTTTHVPTPQVQIPDSFLDGSDEDWEDLTVAGNEGQTVGSETSRQGRTMTSDDLRRYLMRDDASNDPAQHPFLVFMDD